MPDEDTIAGIFEQIAALEDQVRKIRSTERQAAILTRLEKLRKDLEELAAKMKAK